jgi:hypothetical protein
MLMIIAGVIQEMLSAAGPVDGASGTTLNGNAPVATPAPDSVVSSAAENPPAESFRIDLQVPKLLAAAALRWREWQLLLAAEVAVERLRQKALVAGALNKAAEGLDEMIKESETKIKQYELSMAQFNKDANAQLLIFDETFKSV